MLQFLCLRKSMPDKNNNAPVSGSIPDDYQEILHWKLTEKPIQVIVLQIVGIILFVIFGLILFRIAIGVGKLPSHLPLGLSEIGILMLGSLLTLILHELLHGMAMRMFGAKPKYGILLKQLMFYTTTLGYAYRRDQYLAIALAPLVVLSVVVILGMGLLSGTFWVALLALCGAINASGAIGDIWMSLIVLRYPRAAYVVDERDGIRVFMQEINLDQVNH